MFLAEGWREMPAEDVDQLFGRVTVNCDRLEGLLEGLLDLERLSRRVIEPIRRDTDLRALLERSVRTVQDGHHPMRVTGDAVIASVDPGQVERIVENLLANAVRHTPAGTNVTTYSERDHDGVLITVEDTGPGLPPELSETIFEPFAQAPDAIEAGRGTGIGLALVAKFAQLHGGRAWVENVETGGARFRVRLCDVIDALEPDSAEAA